MAKLHFHIDVDDLEYKVIVTFTKDLDQDDIEELLKEMFELEMISADIEDIGESVQISFFTMNTEKVKTLRVSLLRLFQRASGLNEPIYN